MTNKKNGMTITASIAPAANEAVRAPGVKGRSLNYYERSHVDEETRAQHCRTVVCVNRTAARFFWTVDDTERTSNVYGTFLRRYTHGRGGQKGSYRGGNPLDDFREEKSR